MKLQSLFILALTSCAITEASSINGLFCTKKNGVSKRADSEGLSDSSTGSIIEYTKESDESSPYEKMREKVTSIISDLETLAGALRSPDALECFSSEERLEKINHIVDIWTSGKMFFDTLKPSDWEKFNQSASVEHNTWAEKYAREYFRYSSLVKHRVERLAGRYGIDEIVFV